MQVYWCEKNTGIPTLRPRRAAGTGAGQGATAPRKPWRGGLGRAAGTESYHN